MPVTTILPPKWRNPFSRIRPLLSLGFTSGFRIRKDASHKWKAFCSPGSEEFYADLFGGHLAEWRWKLSRRDSNTSSRITAVEWSSRFPIHLPRVSVLSRFVAKVALEAMAFRIVEHPEGLQYLANEPQLDLIRNHARYGHTKEWPIHVRGIYDPDRHFPDETGNIVQTLHEFDIIVTENHEWFFILVIFGLELTINFGGPEIDGYLKWLSQRSA